MNRRFKILLLAPALLLSACAYGLKEIYPGDVYISVDYYKNFYREWDNEINYHTQNSQVDNIDQETYQLDKINNRVFTSFKDDNFIALQPDANQYSYRDDIYEPPEGKKSYGATYALNKVEPSFKYGYVSKLFNGQMFCNGNYENARVQIDEGGFGARFNKEIKEYKYFAINFKASLDYRRDGKSTMIPAHKSDIEITINFYCKTASNAYHRIPVKYEINDIPTNDSNGEFLDGSNYIFFGFDLEEIKIDRCAGISIEYKLLNDEYKNNHPEDNWTHCLLLYEIFLPDSTWH